MLTIREAAEKTGHSPHKIRRLIKAIADAPTHPDRGEIEPSPSDVERLTAEGVQFTWRVTEELVRRELGDATATPAGEKSSAPGVGESPEWLAFMQRLTDAKEKAEERLFEQLRVKDDQLKAKDDQIAALNERLRESNLLMASLQKQLPEPAKKAASIAEPVVAATPKRPEKGSGGATKPKQRGWLRGIFS